MSNTIISEKGQNVHPVSGVDRSRKSGRAITPPGESRSTLAALLTSLVWMIFVISTTLLISFFMTHPTWELKGFFLFDGLTAIMWMAVSFFSGIVHSYALRYMAGYKRLNSFMASCFGFTVATMLMTVADHVVLFGISWCAMGLLMAQLIGHVPGWGEAKASGQNALVYFTGSSLLLTAALALLAFQTQELSISNIISDVSLLSKETSILVAAFLLLTAMIQSAIYPFHGWLMSSMTAPTPASALMHAGFVNAAGILLTRFSPVLYEADFLWVIVLIGGIGALMGEFWKFVQTNIKRKLACSTVAQMSFMLLQCGLGFFTAAITHLILHGFYKAYLFLSSGSAIAHNAPATGKEAGTKHWHLAVIIFSGLAGGILFSFLTGKGFTLNSGLLLTFVVILTIMLGTQGMLRQSTLSGFSKVLAFPLVLFPAIGVYALFYNGISYIMQDLPMAQAPTDLSAIHGLIAFVYLISFLAVESGWYKKSKRLYVALLNVSQPKANTVLNFKK
jgi:NAD(P)H-quinone oxidoreductase subunit 5